MIKYMWYWKFANVCCVYLDHTYPTYWSPYAAGWRTKIWLYRIIMSTFQSVFWFYHTMCNEQINYAFFTTVPCVLHTADDWFTWWDDVAQILDYYHFSITAQSKTFIFLSTPVSGFKFEVLTKCIPCDIYKVNLYNGVVMLIKCHQHLVESSVAFICFTFSFSQCCKYASAAHPDKDKSIATPFFSLQKCPLFSDSYDLNRF